MLSFRIFFFSKNKANMIVKRNVIFFVNSNKFNIIKYKKREINNKLY